MRMSISSIISDGYLDVIVADAFVAVTQKGGHVKVSIPEDATEPQNADGMSCITALAASVLYRSTLPCVLNAASL